MHDKVCEYCSAEFQSKKNTQKYCSKKCARDVQRSTFNIPKCKQCDREFKYKSNSNNIFCSRDCNFKWKEEHKLKENERAANLKRSKFYINKCSECSKSFTSSRKLIRCSAKCDRLHNAREQRKKYIPSNKVIKVCVICKKKAEMKSIQITCSKECSKKYDNSQRKSISHIKRAKKFNAKYEHGISILKLKQRDGNQCLVCGLKVLDINIGGYHKRNATIGHLVPLSIKGTHTWSNIQLECMECNVNLGTTIHGQTRLAI